MFIIDSIKQFLKPDWRKIVVYLFLMFVFSYSFISFVYADSGIVSQENTLDSRLISGPSPCRVDGQNQCNLCSFFYTVKTSINFITELWFIVGLLSLVVLVFAKVIYRDKLDKIKKVKSIAKYIFLFIAIVFIIWILIAVWLQEMGYQSMFKWNQINCDNISYFLPPDFRLG